MELMGVSTAAVRSSITGKVCSSTKNCRKDAAPLAPFFAVKNLQRLAEAPVDGKIVKPLGLAQDRSGRAAIQARSNLLLASLVAGLGGADSAIAISYDNVLENVKEVTNSTAEGFELPNTDIDISGLTDFVSANPLAIIGGIVVLALPVIVSNVVNKLSEGFGTVSAKEAYAKLGDSEAVGTQMLDIRVGDDIRAEGTPDLKRIRKRVVQVPYSEDAESFLGKVKSKFKDAENTTLYILDRFDGNSYVVSKLLAKNGFKAAFAIKDGAEGPNGWQQSELPWLVPRKGFSIDFSNLRDVFDTENSSLVPATLGVAAAAGVGLVVFSEAETALQLLGSAVLVQIFVKKLLFAKDRKRTFEELQIFLDTKIAPKELVEELKGIGKTLLPKYEELPAGTANGVAVLEKSGEPAVSAPLESQVSGASDVSPVNGDTAPSKVAAEIRAEEVTSTPNSTDLPKANRPLSPYSQYPNMKPPTSPIPSRP